MSDLFRKFGFRQERSTQQTELNKDKILISWFAIKTCLNLIQESLMDDLRSTHLQISQETTLEEYENFRETKKKEHAGKNPFEILRDELTGTIYPVENLLAYLPKGFKLRKSQKRLFETLAKKLAEYPNTLDFLKRNLPDWIIQKDTGTGKTLIFTILAHTLPKDHKIAIIVPYISIADQTMKKLLEYFPSDSVSYLSSSDINLSDSRFTKGTDGRIVVIVQDSLDESFIPDTIIIDEDHIVGGDVFDAKFKKVSQDSLILRFTATPLKTRIESIYADDVPILVNPTTIHYVRSRHLKTNIIFQDHSGELVEANELCPVAWSPVKSNISCTSLRYDKVAGDYEKESLSKFFEKNWDTICDDFIKKYDADPKTYKKIFAVCPNSIELAIIAADKFNKQTKKSSVVITSKDCILFQNGKGKKIRRAVAVEKYKKGEIDALFQIRTMREGFDDPEIDCLWMMHFTKSVSDYVQALGRCRRTNPDDPNKIATVYDFIPNSVDVYSPLTAPQVLGYIPEFDDVSDQLIVGPKPRRSEIEQSVEVINAVTETLPTQEVMQDRTEESDSFDFSELVNLNFKNIRDIYNILRENPNLKKICAKINHDRKYDVIFTAIKEILIKLCAEGVSLKSLMVVPRKDNPIIDDIDSVNIQNEIKFNPTLAYFYLEEVLLKNSIQNQDRLQASRQHNQVNIEVTSDKNKTISEIVDKYSKSLDNTESRYTISRYMLERYLTMKLESKTAGELESIFSKQFEFNSVLDEILADNEIKEKSVKLNYIPIPAAHPIARKSKSGAKSEKVKQLTRQDNEFTIFSNVEFQKAWNYITSTLSRERIILEPLYNLDPENILQDTPNEKNSESLDLSRAIFYGFIKYIVCDLNSYLASTGYIKPAAITNLSDLLDKFVFPDDLETTQDLPRLAFDFIENYLRTDLISHPAYGNVRSKRFSSFKQVIALHSLNLDHHFKIFGGQKILKFNQSIIENETYKSLLESVCQNLESYDIGINFNQENKSSELLKKFYSFRAKNGDKACLESWLYRQLNSQTKKADGEICEVNLSTVFTEIEKTVILGHIKRSVSRAFKDDVDLDPKIIKYIDDNILTQNNLWCAETVLGTSEIYSEVKKFIQENPQTKQTKTTLIENIKENVSELKFSKKKSILKEQISQSKESFNAYFKPNILRYLESRTNLFGINQLFKEQIESDNSSVIINKVAKKLNLTYEVLKSEITKKILYTIRHFGGRFDESENKFNLNLTRQEVNLLDSQFNKIEDTEGYEYAQKSLLENKRIEVSKIIDLEIVEQLFLIFNTDYLNKFFTRKKIDPKTASSTNTLNSRIIQKYPNIDIWLSLKDAEKDKAIVLIVNSGRVDTVVTQTNQATSEIFKNELDSVKFKVKELLLDTYPDFDIKHINNEKLTVEFSKLLMKQNSGLSDTEITAFATQIIEELNLYTKNNEKKLVLDINIFRDVQKIRPKYSVSYEKICEILSDTKRSNPKDKTSDSKFFGIIYPREYILRVLAKLDSEHS